MKILFLSIIEASYRKLTIGEPNNHNFVYMDKNIPSDDFSDLYSLKVGRLDKRKNERSHVVIHGGKLYFYNYRDYFHFSLAEDQMKVILKRTTLYPKVEYYKSKRPKKLTFNELNKNLKDETKDTKYDFFKEFKKSKNLLKDQNDFNKKENNVNKVKESEYKEEESKKFVKRIKKGNNKININNLIEEPNDSNDTQQFMLYYDKTNKKEESSLFEFESSSVF
ncbi:hypothetical protein A0H76_1484 [Hepatospora eriocheir]|uniref:Uncharacterized protein n=1 Tax=Hepatospora eriocheir TaxID=1081669 RepID=A0A1X0QH19_9MICR|nr:hypothetical protein A0H76_1484 [Hepatospora eriocheir]